MASAYLYYEQVNAAATDIRARIKEVPSVAVVLGSGLGDFAQTLTDSIELPYSSVPNWPVSNVIGHAGKLVIGTVGKTTVAALAGRAHAYEGHDLKTVTFAMRVMGLLGVKIVILTNAVGGVNTSFKVGDLMLITDHVNLQGCNPLTGPNDDRFGPRFPDMSEIYSFRLREIADKVGTSLGKPPRHGVLATMLGPSYETPAEIKMLRVIGCDAVGMSVAPEAIVARHSGLEVLGISCITNMAAGVLPQPLSHSEVTETAKAIKPYFTQVISDTIKNIPFP